MKGYQDLRVWESFFTKRGFDMEFPILAEIPEVRGNFRVSC